MWGHNRKVRGHIKKKFRLAPHLQIASDATDTKYLAQLCGRFFGVFENFRSKFANLVTPPTDGTTKRLVRC